jgi:hypothetical protein
MKLAKVANRGGEKRLAQDAGELAEQAEFSAVHGKVPPTSISH